MIEATRRRLLFVINHFSGRKASDWESVILKHFESLPFDINIYPLPEKFDVSTIRSTIELYKPDQVIAVGGDGTVNLLATCIRNTEIGLGILPAGSANGMAKELGIADVALALKTIENGFSKKISLLDINGKISLHLADIGLNAYMLREFEKSGIRGFIGYLIASVRVLGRRRELHVEVSYKNTKKTVHADIILIANATMYGTGVVVNPVGKLDDDVFEVIAIKNLTLKDLVKTSLTTLRLDESKAEIFQASEINLHCKKAAHFQVDGEYVGKVRDIAAKLLPDSLKVLVPEESKL